MDNNPYKSPIGPTEPRKRQGLLLRVLDILAFVHACAPLLAVGAYTLLWNYLPLSDETTRIVGYCLMVLIYLFILATVHNGIRAYYGSALAMVGIAVALLTIPAFLLAFVS